jgi:hypothetical protein
VLILLVNGNLQYQMNLDSKDRLKSSSFSHQRILVLVAVLLIIFASRITRLPTLDMEKDEVWSVWQTFGTPQQIVSWTPYDWTPTYYFVVAAWQNLTGINPLTLRLLSVFTFMIGVALLYRVTTDKFGANAALITILAYSTLGYMLFLSTLLRGYIFIGTLWILALWLGIRYFERPTRARAVMLALALTAMFYIHVATIFGSAMIVVYTLVMYWRSFQRWLLPGLITAVLCLPAALAMVSAALIKNSQTPAVAFTLPVLEFRLVNHYIDYLGQYLTLWIIFFVLATALIVDRYRAERRVIVLVLWMLAPVAVMIFGTSFQVFNPRHIPWVMFGIAIWIGWGLSLLSQAAVVAISGIFAVTMFGYVPLNERYEIESPRVPLVQTYSALTHYVRIGDVVYIDPKCDDCANVAPEEWDYFNRAYFPQGLKFVTDLHNYSRVWYIAAEGKETPQTLNALTKTHAASISLGVENLHFQLYEAPPDPQGTVFESGLRFNGAEILNDAGLPLAWHEGDTVTLRLWWSIDRPQKSDYSEATYVLDSKDGKVVSQFDSPPLVLNGPKETSQWLVDRYYIEERKVKLPYPLSTSHQQLALTIYQWWDGKRLSAPGLNADNLLLLDKVFVKAW